MRPAPFQNQDRQSDQPMTWLWTIAPPIVAFLTQLTSMMLFNQGVAGVLCAAPAFSALKTHRRQGFIATGLSVVLEALVLMLAHRDIDSLGFTLPLLGVAFCGIIASLLARPASDRRSSDSFFRVLVEQSMVGVVVIGRDGFHYVNPAFAMMHGYSDPDAIMANPAALQQVARHDRDRIEDIMERQFSEIGRVESFIMEGQHSDGSTVTLQAFGRSIMSPQGPVIVAVSVDVSELVSARETLSAQRALLDRMSALAHIGGWRLDVTHRRIHRTLEAARILGLDENDPRSLNTELGNALEFVVGNGRGDLFQAIESTLTTGRPYSMELEITTSDGQRKWIRSQGAPVVENGRIVAVDGAMQDITEVRAARADLERQQQNLESVVQERTADLQAALEEAARLTSVKSLFLANMSHEIRTPLNGVLGLAQIGQRQATGELRRTFDLILESGSLLMGIVNDILDFSKIEAGRLDVETIPVNIREIMEHVNRQMSDRAQQKGLSMRVIVEASVPHAFMSDPIRLQQILLNLTSNAIKFTETGSVSVRATLHNGDLRLTVADTGMGMSAEHCARLFLPFEQADPSTTRKFGGTGLGLAITKRLVELMGGTINVESEVGKGTLFEILMPLLQTEEAAHAKPQVLSPEEALARTKGRLKGIRILAVEDNPINQIVLTEFLKIAGADTVLAPDGETAVKHLEDTPDFDIALMDIQMPGMDGYETCLRLRALVPDLPVIAQTAQVQAAETRRCFEVGMVDVLSKPLVLDALADALERHARKKH